MTEFPEQADFKLSFLLGEVQVWYASPCEPEDAEFLELCEQVLSPAELSRGAKFIYEEDKLLYQTAHVLLRSVLSQYANVAPAEWQFETGPYGKPYLNYKASIEGELHQPLQFNLSHTTGLAAVAVCRSGELGLDAEHTAREADYAGLAKRFFAPTESEVLSTLSGEDQRRRFFEYWTLKESYIKACGGGMSIPLEQFAFQFVERPVVMPPSADGSSSEKAARKVFRRLPEISFAAGLEDNPARWQFELHPLSDGHLLAVAVTLEGNPVRNITYRAANRELLGLRA